MKLTITSAVLALVLNGCAHTSQSCSRPPKPRPVSLHPGVYEIELLALSGSRKGSVTKGRLVLRRSSPEDRSPVSGKGPWRDDHHPFWGWLTADLDLVGAPLASDGVPADSQDPITPGVLVEVVDSEPGYPPETPLLLIGTANQTRNLVIDSDVISVGTDGSGIGLWPHKGNESELTGRWSGWGIVHDGQGVFCAKVIDDAG